MRNCKHEQCISESSKHDFAQGSYVRTKKKIIIILTVKQIRTRIYSQMDEDIQRYAATAFLMDTLFADAQIRTTDQSFVWEWNNARLTRFTEHCCRFCGIPIIHQDLDSRSHLIECKRTKEIYLGALKSFMQLIQSTPHIDKEIQLLAPQIFDAHKTFFRNNLDQKTFFNHSWTIPLFQLALSIRRMMYHVAVQSQYRNRDPLTNEPLHTFTFPTTDQLVEMAIESFQHKLSYINQFYINSAAPNSTIAKSSWHHAFFF